MPPAEEDGGGQLDLVVHRAPPISQQIEHARHMRMAVVAAAHHMDMPRVLVVGLVDGIVPAFSSSSVVPELY